LVSSVCEPWSVKNGDVGGGDVILMVGVAGRSVGEGMEVEVKGDVGDTLPAPTRAGSCEFIPWFVVCGSIESSTPSTRHSGFIDADETIRIF